MVSRVQTSFTLKLYFIKKMKKPVTQKERIVKFLTKGRLLTAKQAKSFGIEKPSARICELRKKGLNILSTTNKSGVSAWKLA